MLIAQKPNLWYFEKEHSEPSIYQIIYHKLLKLSTFTAPIP